MAYVLIIRILFVYNIVNRDKVDEAVIYYKIENNWLESYHIHFFVLKL